MDLNRQKKRISWIDNNNSVNITQSEKQKEKERRIMNKGWETPTCLPKYT